MVQHAPDEQGAHIGLMIWLQTEAKTGKSAEYVTAICRHRWICCKNMSATTLTGLQSGTIGMASNDHGLESIKLVGHIETERTR